MVLQLSDPPPEEALDLVRENVAPASDPELSVQKLSAAEPQPIYTSTIDALIENRLLDAARLTGWQYVLLTGAGADLIDGVVEVARLPEGDEPLAVDTRYPRAYAEAINSTIAVAETVPGDYSLRMLRVPSVYLLAVWLHGGVAGDLLFPVPPAPSMLRAHTLFTEAALTEALRPLAVKRFLPDASAG